MTPTRTALLALVLALALVASGRAGSTASDAPTASREGPPSGAAACPTFPRDNWWNTDISRLPVHRRSDDWMARMSPRSDLHPDFGPTLRYGIPVTYVGGSHPKVRVRFQYADESDRVRYPLGRDTRIEGGPGAGGDRHAIVVDRSTCRLYETWLTVRRGSRWTAGSGAVWNLRSNRLRPDGWTSADAAGLPILPGLLTWPEVKRDRIDHAIRFTTDVTSEHYLWPARHEAGSRSSLAFPPMGARFRLDADYDTSGLGRHARRVVEAMQTYGLVLADNGSPWYFQGASSRAWPSRLVEDLKTIPASAFEAVDTSCLMTPGGRDSAEASLRLC